MDPIETFDYVVQSIVENQRADTLPILPGQTDLHYFKQHLLETDPAPWSSASSGASCTPATVPIPDGYVILKPWAYIVTEPSTDSGGWIYKLDFNHHVEENQHKAVLPHITKIRYRHWKRTCVPADHIDDANKVKEKQETFPAKMNGYNINSIRRMYRSQIDTGGNAKILARQISQRKNSVHANSEKEKEKEKKGTVGNIVSCQVLCECCRTVGHDNAGDPTAGSNPPDVVNDPHYWSIFVPFNNSLRLFNMHSHSNSLIDSNGDYAPASPHDLDIPDAWEAVRGFSFLVDCSTSDAGWQYNTAFIDQSCHSVGTSNVWENEHKSHHRVKRRFWCRILAPQFYAETARDIFVTYIGEHKRGVVKTDVFCKQGHLHQNWNKRTFVLTDHYLTYKTDAGLARGAICIDRKMIEQRDMVGAGSEFTGETGKSCGFVMRDAPPPVEKSDRISQVLAIPPTRDSRIKAVQMLLQPRMSRGYLNMDALSCHRRLEWMDVLRQQIWLVVKRTGLRVDKPLRLPWRKESVTTMSLVALNKYLFMQDVVGAPVLSSLKPVDVNEVLRSAPSAKSNIPLFRTLPEESVTSPSPIVTSDVPVDNVSSNLDASDDEGEVARVMCNAVEAGQDLQDPVEAGQDLQDPVEAGQDLQDPATSTVDMHAAGSPVVDVTREAQESEKNLEGVVQSWIMKKLSSEKKFSRRFIWLENALVDDVNAVQGILDVEQTEWRLYWVKQVGAYPVNTSPINSSIFTDSLKYVVLSHVSTVLYPAQFSKKAKKNGTEFSLVIKDEYLSMYSSHPNKPPALYVLPAYSAKIYNSIDFRASSIQDAVRWVEYIRVSLQ